MYYAATYATMLTSRHLRFRERIRCITAASSTCKYAATPVSAYAAAFDTPTLRIYAIYADAIRRFIRHYLTPATMTMNSAGRHDIATLTIYALRHYRFVYITPLRMATRRRHYYAYWCRIRPADTPLLD